MHKELLAEQLHEWYLEACRLPGSGFDFNPKAQEPYHALTEEQKFLDRFIAKKVIALLAASKREGAIAERASILDMLRAFTVKAPESTRAADFTYDQFVSVIPSLEEFKKN